MSAETDYQRFAKDLQSLRAQIAKASSDVATARKAESTARASASRSTSSSQVQSKNREAERYADRAVAAERSRANLESKAADKERHLNAARSRMDKESLKRTRESDQRQKRAMSDLERRLRAASAVPHADIRLTQLSSPASEAPQYDLFISHASEDKAEVARPLYDALVGLGLTVWYDEAVLSVGDSLRRKIDEGLANSSFGVVVFSPAFFAKEWPQSELDGLFARQLAGGQKVVLPIWHSISKDAMLLAAPMFADTLALKTSLLTIDEIAHELLAVVRPEDD